jgi:hypothetical protein
METILGLIVVLAAIAGILVLASWLIRRSYDRRRRGGGMA